MINKKRINNVHKQYFNSCLLSNYAVACNYYTNIEIEQFFIDYLKKYKSDFLDLKIFNCSNNSMSIMSNEFKSIIDSNFEISKTKRFIKTYEIYLYDHLIKTCQNNKPYPFHGLEFIEYLHVTCAEMSFSDSRDKINLYYYRFNEDDNVLLYFEYGSNKPKDKLNKITLNNEIQNKECILNIYSNITNELFKNGHSHTIYCDKGSNNIFLHDTNLPNSDKVISHDWIDYFTKGQVLKYLPKTF